MNEKLTSKEKVERLRHVFEDARRMVRSWTLPHTEALFNIIADMQQEIEGLQMGQPPVVVVSTADEPSTLHRDQIKAICHALNDNCVMVDDPERPPCTFDNCVTMKAAARAEVPTPAPRFSPTECKHEAVHFKCTDCGLDLREGRLSVPPAALRQIAERIRDHACAYGAPADSVLVKRELIGRLAQVLGGSIAEPPSEDLQCVAREALPYVRARIDNLRSRGLTSPVADEFMAELLQLSGQPSETKEAPRPLGGRTWTQEEIDADQFREEQRAQEKGDPHAKYVCVQPEFEVKVAGEKFDGTPGFPPENETEARRRRRDAVMRQGGPLMPADETSVSRYHCSCDAEDPEHCACRHRPKPCECPCHKYQRGNT